MRVAMGIDVGWSKRRRTCAVAIKGLEHDAFQNYPVGKGQSPVQVGCFTLKGLLGFIPGFVAQHRRQLEDVVMVVDGPLWPGAVVSRPVDALFSRGTFQGLLQPSDVSLDTPEAVKYRQTTDLIISAFRKAGLVQAPWFGGEVPPTSVVAETNPTVAMALLLKRQDPANVPSRRRPFRVVPG